MNKNDQGILQSRLKLTLRAWSIVFRPLTPRNPFPHRLSEIAKAAFAKDSSPRFLNECLSHTGRSHGLLTTSGREAFYLILKTFFEPGDEIILPAFTCNVLIGPIRKLGVNAVFADVSPTTLNMELEHIRARVTPSTRGVVLTHQFGYPLDVEPILQFCKELNLFIIEDAAPAFGGEWRGRPTGSRGDIAFFSFQRTKVISTLDGGLIVGSEKNIERIVKCSVEKEPSPSFAFIIRAILLWLAFLRPIYRWTFTLWMAATGGRTGSEQWTPDLDRYEMAYGGLSRFQKNLGLAQLRSLKQTLKSRTQAARFFNQVLEAQADVIKPAQPLLTDGLATFARFPVLLGPKWGETEKDLLAAKIELHRIANHWGVDLGFTFPYKMTSYFDNQKDDRIPQTDWIIDRVLNIPIHLDEKVNRKTVRVLEMLVNGLKKKL